MELSRELHLADLKWKKYFIFIVYFLDKLTKFGRNFVFSFQYNYQKKKKIQKYKNIIYDIPL
jgi:hypothetical protein